MVIAAVPVSPVIIEMTRVVLALVKIRYECKKDELLLAMELTPPKK